MSAIANGDTPAGQVFGAGLTGLAVAWLVTTGLALAAVRRRQIPQHAEWMVRSYVVTFAFVTFRLAWAALRAAEVGTLPEQLAAASWLCWSAPLLFTEAILQGRKIVDAAWLGATAGTPKMAEGGTMSPAGHCPASAAAGSPPKSRYPWLVDPFPPSSIGSSSRARR